MMIKLTRTDNLKTIKNILENPVLFRCTYGQSLNKLELEDIINREWVLVTIDEEPVGCFEIRDFTKITLEVHIHILPRYWNQTTEIVKEAEQWARDNKYSNIFSSVPSNCIHMIKFMERMKYQPCGQIVNGIIYKGYKVSLFLYSKQL